VPRSQIDTARLDAQKDVINIVGPLEMDGPGVALDIHVTLLQGDAYAHGHGTDTRAGSGQGTWTAAAEVVGTFEAGKPVEAFGIVVVVEPDPQAAMLAPPHRRRVHQTFTWSERVKLDVQL
jgi:hypothetical protein